MAANAFKDTWASLQKELDMVARFLLGSLSLAYRPRLVLKDADTASTDGQHVVEMPRRFMGVGLEDGRPEIFLGLLAHEIGHWLQPVKEIDAVEKKTNLMHGFVNIVLDVHCEHQAGLIFPLFKHPIKAVRDLVQTTMARRYRREFRKAQDFVTAALTALLYSRYCVHTDFSYCCATIDFQKGALWPASKRAYDLDRLRSLLSRIQTVADLHASALPALFEELAKEYPELCCEPPKGLSLDPLAGPAGDGEISDAVQLSVPPEEDCGPCAVQEIESYGTNPPSREVQTLSRKLKNRWTAPVSAQNVMAPGRLDRMAALRGAPMPFSMRSNKPSRTKETGLKKIFLGPDWSGSMDQNNGTPWNAALAAARAIALTIREDDGDVRALLFAQQAWHTRDFDAISMLFARSLSGPVNLDHANGPDTHFGWLPEIWQRFPEHQILVLTDGAGKLPAYIPEACRKRTSVLLLGLENYEGEQLDQIRSIANAIAAKVVEVSSPDDLAGVWATLIPRQQIA